MGGRSGNATSASAGDWLRVVLAPASWTLFFFAAWALPAAVCGSPFEGWLAVAAAACLATAVVGPVLLLRRSRSGGSARGRGFLLEVGTLVGAMLAVSLLLALAFALAIGPCR